MSVINVIGFPRCATSSLVYDLVKKGEDVYYYDGNQYSEARFSKFYKDGFNIIVTRKHQDWSLSFEKLFKKKPYYTHDQRIKELQDTGIQLQVLQFEKLTKLIPNITNDNPLLEEPRKKAMLRIQRG